MRCKHMLHMYPLLHTRYIITMHEKVVIAVGDWIVVPLAKLRAHVVDI